MELIRHFTIFSKSGPSNSSGGGKSEEFDHSNQEVIDIDCASMTDKCCSQADEVSLSNVFACENSTEPYDAFMCSEVAENHDKKPTRMKCYLCPYATCTRRFHLKGTFKMHLALHEDDRFKCHVCQKVYKCQNSLTVHQAKHHDTNGEPKYFPCPVAGCLYVCRSRTLLRLHDSSEHGTTDAHKYKHLPRSPSFSCKECGKCFTTRKGLASHVLIVHRNKKVYTCELCGYEFSKLSNFTRHSRIHKDKNYFCNICSANFGYARSFTSHMITIHPFAWKKQLASKKSRRAFLSSS